MTVSRPVGPGSGKMCRRAFVVLARPGVARPLHRRSHRWAFESGAIALAALAAISNGAFAQSVSYSFDEVMESVRSGQSTDELVHGVQMRCLGFRVTGAVLTELEAAGAAQEFTLRLAAACNLQTQGVLARNEKLSVARKADGRGILNAIEARVWRFWAARPLGCSASGSAVQCSVEVINGQDPAHGFCVHGALIGVHGAVGPEWLDPGVSLVADADGIGASAVGTSHETREPCAIVEGHGSWVLVMRASLPLRLDTLDVVSFRLVDQEQRDEVPAWAEVTFRNVAVRR